ncbi:MAG: cytochrome c oxidase accessory protein CcoG [Bacteroidetes bacterium]|nr:MAG: cytochrome c oxidase accessory protein CcoG [Bacteroidota bacterium]
MDFRDTLGVLDKKGVSKRIYPKMVDGFLFKARNVVGFFLLAFLFSAPFVKIDGQPLLLLNVLERKFIIFGKIFFPQDTYIFALAMLVFMVFIILFTVVFGRVFCGWACPQTIFLELIFRRIEHWIEGDANQQRKLNEGEWTSEKIWKKTLKHTIFVLISFFIANTFLAYLVGIEELERLVTHSPLENLTLFVSLLIFTSLFYYVFAKFRELVCIVVCPYGRLQSVFLDNKSIVVAYDFLRGEPRGKLKKNEVDPAPKGDCIDCKLCVQVCPTGIDIRNGTQMECVNCTACIDACDDIMEKIGKPKKLIRYDSMEGITEKKPLRFTARIAAYSTVLALLLGLLSYFLLSRDMVGVTVLKTPGMLFQKPDSLTISNLYNIELINKTSEKMNLTIKVKDEIGTIKLVTNDTQMAVESQQAFKTSFFIFVPKKNIYNMNSKLEIEVYSEGKLITKTKTSFTSPVAYAKK